LGVSADTAGFITSKRQTENVVVVRDNQTIVIGGLIGTTETAGSTKIPILGDLPLVGVLFRSKTVTDRKTNLLIFLTPHVINEPADLEEVYRIKMAQREEFLRRFYGRSRDEQEAELRALMSGSMNFVDKPSQYREKAAPTDSGTSREIPMTNPAQPVPQPTGDITPPPAPPAPAPEDGP
jgi:general secretion pathway protein D